MRNPFKRKTTMQRIRQFADEIFHSKVKRTEHVFLFYCEDGAVTCVGSNLQGVAAAMAAAAVTDAEFRKFIESINKSMEDYEKTEKDSDRGGNS